MCEDANVDEAVDLAMPLCSTIRDNVVVLDHEHLYMNVFMMSS